jgi:OOP family OmpA-OmpF porin
MTKCLKPSQAALAVTLALVAGAAGAVPGYATTAGNGAITDSSGHCWKTGDWTPDKAAAPCDAVPRAATPAAPLAVQEQPPAPVAPPTVIEKVSLNSDVLFEFDKSVLRPEGRAKLDELATRLGDARVDRVEVAGYADRIGKEKYNEQLSQRRAEAVQEYLAQSAKLAPQQVQAEGRGEANPVTGQQCAKMGPERKSNKKLVDCLQPDRRVEIQVLGSREVAGTPGAPSSGASSSSSSPSPSSGASSSGSASPSSR